MANENLEVIKLGDSNPEYLETANALVAFDEGQDLTINPEALFDFFEFTKRLKKQVDTALAVIESYVRTKEANDECPAHFSFAASAKSLAIIDEKELIRILKEDFGKDSDFIQECSKVDPKLLMEKLKDYTKEGMVNAFPNCIELKAAKPRMLAK